MLPYRRRACSSGRHGGGRLGSMADPLNDRGGRELLKAMIRPSARGRSEPLSHTDSGLYRGADPYRNCLQCAQWQPSQVPASLGLGEIARPQAPQQDPWRAAGSAPRARLLAPWLQMDVYDATPCVQLDEISSGLKLLHAGTKHCGCLPGHGIERRRGWEPRRDKERGRMEGRDQSVSNQASATR